MRLIVTGLGDRLESDTAADAEALESCAAQGEWRICRGRQRLRRSGCWPTGWDIRSR